MNSEAGSWRVHIRKPAEKNLLRAPKHERQRLLRALEEMQHDPLRGDVVRLHNVAAFRRRVGDWRILFDIHHSVHLVEVLYIERRTTTTYRKR